MGLLLQVKVNFLPVGHTHEDIDQLFSKISTEIRRAGSESLQGMIIYRINIIFVKKIARIFILLLFYIFTLYTRYVYETIQ